MDQTESLQKQHFNNLAESYSKHYADPTSQEYQKRFIFNKMFHGIDVKNKQVLDAMCGMGSTTRFLLTQNAFVTSLDIADEFIEICKQSVPESKKVKASILNMPFEKNTFDYIIIVGGLHHLHPKLNEGIIEIHRVLKPGGLLICLEPPANSWIDKIRKLWYKRDHFFEDNEQSIAIDEILKNHKNIFRLNYIKYGNGPAYFLIYNSLILRVPLNLKKFIATPLFFIEKLLEKLVIPQTSAYVVFRLEKLKD